MPTMALTLSYNGSSFSGFARQKDERLSTVQGELEAALALLFRREVTTVCAGRTDAGVHARSQVVSFELSEDELATRSERTLFRSLNALTDRAIGVKGIRRVRDGFSARFDAVSREYRYYLANQPTPSLALRDFSWHVPYSLDIEAMGRGGMHLIGEHDFKSFCLASSAVGKSTVREILDLSVSRRCIMGDDMVEIRIVGTAFLHSMVRTIAGTLVAVGRGQREADWVRSALEARDRSAAGEKAPACGLTFWNVVYDPRDIGCDGRLPGSEIGVNDGEAQHQDDC